MSEEMDSKPVWDLRNCPRQFIIDFIQEYKAFPVLWHRKFRHARNRDKKLAYKQLTALAQRTFPEADVHWVCRRIQSIRSSFKKEMNKVEAAQKEGKSYNSGLWYFELMLFIRDAREKDIFDDLEQNSDDFDEDPITCEDVERIVKKEKNDELLYTTLKRKQKPVDDETHRKRQSSRSNPFSQVVIETHANQIEYENDTNSLPIECDYNSSIDTTSKIDEHELLAINVKLKLKRMTCVQQIYAESLISTILTQGLLNELCRQTVIYNVSKNSETKSNANEIDKNDSDRSDQ